MRPEVVPVVWYKGAQYLVNPVLRRDNLRVWQSHDSDSGLVEGHALGHLDPQILDRGADFRR